MDPREDLRHLLGLHADHARRRDDRLRGARLRDLRRAVQAGPPLRPGPPAPRGPAVPRLRVRHLLGRLPGGRRRAPLHQGLCRRRHPGGLRRPAREERPARDVRLRLPFGGPVRRGLPGAGLQQLRRSHPRRAAHGQPHRAASRAHRRAHSQPPPGGTWRSSAGGRPAWPAPCACWSRATRSRSTKEASGSAARPTASSPAPASGRRPRRSTRCFGRPVEAGRLEIKLGVALGQDVSLDELRGRHDAVFLAPA